MQTSIAFAAALILALPVLAHEKHVHGEAQLTVAIDSDTVNIDLEMPLDVAVGFERAPRNDKEKAALAKAGKLLEDAAGLWLPTPAAQCSVRSVKVGMPEFSGGEHADVDASYVFRCASPAALKSVETTLFKSFPRLQRIEAQRAGSAGQGAQRLTPAKPVLGW